MSEPTKLRAQASGGNAVVRVLMSHEMESGQRKDASGKTVPAWHITEVVVAHNGKTVLTMACGTSVSKNPFLQFTLKGAKAGDRVSLQWRDNRGETRTDEALVT